MPRPPVRASLQAACASPPAARLVGGGGALEAGASAHLYSALRARDARFDGRLFVGVTSTGVYCRPVCRVRTPLARNCRFFGNAASAEAAGFRPCLRCRPELAPGLAFVDSSRALALAAARRLAQSVLEGRPVALPALAATLGVSDRHLRRIFAAEHGVSPVDYLATQRLLHAKRLLTDTALPVTQVALASGFGSLRRFNATFADRYRMSPSALRRAHDLGTRAREAMGGAHAGLRLRIGYRPPYDHGGMLRFLAQRTLARVEAVDAAGLTLRRTLAIGHQGQVLRGWVEARFDLERHEVAVEVAPALVPVLGAVLRRLREALDLDADPALVDPVLPTLPGAPRPGVRVPGAFDGFEAAVRVILGQQVTVAAACTLAARIVEAYGTQVETPFAGLDRLFPDAATLAAADAAALGRLGIVRQRVRALQALACEVAGGRLALEPGMPLEPALRALRAMPGIGEWTVQMIALRALGWPDAFPPGDLGVLDALVPLLGRRDARAAAALAEIWRPWRGYAVLRLWQHLED